MGSERTDTFIHPEVPGPWQISWHMWKQPKVTQDQYSEANKEEKKTTSPEAYQIKIFHNLYFEDV